MKKQWFFIYTHFFLFSHPRSSIKFNLACRRTTTRLQRLCAFQSVSHLCQCHHRLRKHHPLVHQGPVALDPHLVLLLLRHCCCRRRRRAAAVVDALLQSIETVRSRPRVGRVDTLTTNNACVVS